MKIATWNINSIRHRLGHLRQWLDEERPDVVALQETKCPDEQFPAAELSSMGYRSAFHGEKGFNGVAILCREPLVPSQLSRGMPCFVDRQCRLMAATIGNLRVISLYAVSGQSQDTERLDYKLRWLSALRDYLFNELEAHPELIVAGDFNVAPRDEDVHSPALYREGMLCSTQERLAYSEILALGLKDAFRLFPQTPSTYTWWRNGPNAFALNIGLRLDHILLSPTLAPRCTNCLVTTNPRRQWRPSDHAPVLAELD